MFETWNPPEETSIYWFIKYHLFRLCIFYSISIEYYSFIHGTALTFLTLELYSIFVSISDLAFKYCDVSLSVFMKNYAYMNKLMIFEVKSAFSFINLLDGIHPFLKLFKNNPLLVFFWLWEGIWGDLGFDDIPKDLSYFLKSH